MTRHSRERVHASVARVVYRYAGSYVNVCTITAGTHSYLDEKERDNYARSVYKQWHVKEAEGNRVRQR